MLTGIGTLLVLLLLSAGGATAWAAPAEHGAEEPRTGQGGARTSAGGILDDQSGVEASLRPSLAPPDARGATFHEFFGHSGDPYSIALRDAEACALPRGVQGPSSAGSRGVRLSITQQDPAGRPSVPVPADVFYASATDLVVTFSSTDFFGEVTAVVECLAPEGAWEIAAEVSYSVLATDFPPIGVFFSAEEFDPVVSDGQVLLRLWTQDNMMTGESAPTLDEVSAEIDGEPVEITGSPGDVRIAMPDDAEPGLHLLSLIRDAPYPAWVVVPVVNGFAAAVEPAPLPGTGADGVPRLDELSTDPRTIAIAVAVAAAAGGAAWLLIGFPSDVFNKSLEGNRGRIGSWWQRLGRLVRGPGRQGRGKARFSLSSGAAFLTFCLISAGFPVLLGWEPPPEGTPLLDFLGLVVAVLVTTLVYSCAAEVADHRWSGVEGRFDVAPFALIVVAVCSLTSYLAQFDPGYFYGLVGGFVAVSQRGAAVGDAPATGANRIRAYEGRATLLAAVCVLGTSVLAYLMWNSVAALVDDAGSNSFGALLLEKSLLAIFLVGIQTVVFGLLPMRFLDGYRLWSWRRTSWAAVYLPATLVFVYLLLMHPDEAAGKTVPDSLLATAVLFGAFGALSLTVWGFFVWRVHRETSAPQPPDSLPAAPTAAVPVCGGDRTTALTALATAMARAAARGTPGSRPGDPPGRTGEPAGDDRPARRLPPEPPDAAPTAVPGDTDG
ncbi:FGLLP motif-containing membrane protein [Nocardiopsis ansamitocini]|uniref:Uncharacterized protein n=1 Tax=Nocardiopsis ansamitocini TaxID=1670832 RepID=A0A9W6P2A9_9ACTN|nr:FGLLP motif-containing membrane protein [Nocardiopsis ansamitocini]GLU45728.1 hypothetical protein Nans01_00790 [Nocardiopsis ansamitocini]